ncbi:MAG: hypothetical protein DMF11_13880 [Verrucomicrobia bacterium]|nr:MAG: hypothetical protein DMF11_13880 [Verrucomicrobiota bacterium]
MRVLFRRRLRLITITGATTDIVTTAIITDIIISAATTGTAFGLPVPVGIIAIGKRVDVAASLLDRGSAQTNSKSSPLRKEVVEQVAFGVLHEVLRVRSI